MHHESYHSFQRFLKSKKVSIRTLQIIRFYHYGESKKIGNVDNPFTQEEMIEKYSPYFLQASKELDDDKLIKAVVNRCIIIGTSSGKTPIDYLYYGDLEHGNLLSRKDIYSIVLAYREHGKSPIHFGGLNYNPNSRKLGSRDRNYVRIKWSILAFLYYCNDEQLEKMKRGKFSSSDLHSPASAH